MILAPCNFQFAHGRKGFELELGEERQIGVVLGKAFDRVGDKTDKWLAHELEVAPPSAADLDHHNGWGGPAALVPQLLNELARCRWAVSGPQPPQ